MGLKVCLAASASNKRFSAAECLDTLAGIGKVRAEPATRLSMNFLFSAMLKLELMRLRNAVYLMEKYKISQLRVFCFVFVLFFSKNGTKLSR